MPYRKKHCETTKSLKICYFFNINQEQAYRTKISEIDELKRRINSQWATLSHMVIECAIVDWRQHPRACARAGGGHFEHTL